MRYLTILLLSLCFLVPMGCEEEYEEPGEELEEEIEDVEGDIEIEE